MSHHCLIRLIVSYNLAQQQSSLEELVFAIEGGLALPAPNPISKRKRTNLIATTSQKRRHSTRVRTNLEVAENPQDSISQPIEFSSPVSEQNLQIEGQENPESDHDEESRHSEEEERDESKIPSTSSPLGDLLHDIELA